MIEQILLEQYEIYYRLAISYVHSESMLMILCKTAYIRLCLEVITLKKPEYDANWGVPNYVNECFRFLKQPHIVRI